MGHQVYYIQATSCYVINYVTYWGIICANSELIEELKIFMT